MQIGKYQWIQGTDVQKRPGKLNTGQAATKTGAQAGTQAITQAATRTGTQVATRVGTQAATQAATKTGAQAATQATAQAAAQVGIKAAPPVLAGTAKGTALSGAVSSGAAVMSGVPTTSGGMRAGSAAGLLSGGFQEVLDQQLRITAPEPNLENMATQMEAAATTGDLVKMRKTAQDFEAVFLNMMFKSMRSGIESGGLIEKSYARSVFEDMYFEEATKEMSRGKGTGLGEMVYQDLLKMYNRDKKG